MTRRVLRQMGGETTDQRAHRLARIATASYPPARRRVAIDAFVAGYLACVDDLVDVDDEAGRPATRR